MKNTIRRQEMGTKMNGSFQPECDPDQRGGYLGRAHRISVGGNPQADHERGQAC